MISPEDRDAFYLNIAKKTWPRTRQSPEDRAAQIWCKPYMASKEMDSELCRLIAAEMEAYASECVQEASKSYFAQGYKEGVEAASQTQIRAAVKEANEMNGVASVVVAQRNLGKAEAYADAAKIVASLAGAKRQCAETYDGHDDRWCSVCENMIDAYLYAEEQIRARAAEVGK